MAIVHLGNVLQGTAYSSGIDTRIPWSALEYSGGTQVITGISGSAIGGNIDSATVSAIASSYVESGVSGKMDASASSQFAPSGDYYSATNPSGFVDSSYVASSISGKMDSSASSSFYPSDNPSGFITGVELSSYATTAYVDSSVSGKLDASASSQFAPSGDYYSATNPSGFITGVDLSPYAYESSLSSKMDASASSDFYPTGNPSGFLTGVDLSDYVPISAVSSWSSQIETLSAMVTALEQRVPTAVYTLSAGYGISLVNDDENQVTTIGTV